MGKLLVSSQMLFGKFLVVDFFLNEIFITLGTRLMKLYTTPPSILTLVTWIPQSRLAFGLILQCAASLADGGYS